MKNKKILVTGGCGYIGAHTIVDLIENGFDIVSADDLSHGSLAQLAGVEKIIGKSVQNYAVDLSDLAAARAIFEEHPDIAGIIHFAAYKSVPESVREPLEYYRNNIGSLVNMLALAQEFSIKHFIFSSSCSVYGNTAELPVSETALFGEAESPYARTKQIGENICKDFARADPDSFLTMLRYFNPVGAHPSALIGERQDAPENLVPVITQTAAGIRKGFQVFGADYPTRDGTCVRDYVHVMDIAGAHTKALMHSMSAGTQGKQENFDVFNLGLGQGVTVFELIHAFEKVSGKKLDYAIAPRRPGDVVSIYADPKKARDILGWKPKYILEDMMESAWKWQLSLKNSD